jgi:hypothetical protein
MKPKLIIEEFIRSKREIKEPITKFGGQPVWLSGPEWPISKGWYNRPMMFVAQIALDNRIFENGDGKMAYIFITHCDNPNDDFFDPDIIYPDEGENAVIIQPIGNALVNTIPLENGPTLFDHSGSSYEAYVRLRESEDPDFIDSFNFKKMSGNEKRQYCDIIEGNKLGGTPYFFQGDEWPEGKMLPLLIQLNSSFLPFYLNLGSSPTVFSFLDESLKSGKLLIQDM